jgi:predicted lipoprotein with Yx(FWY)xxD motif
MFRSRTGPASAAILAAAALASLALITFLAGHAAARPNAAAARAKPAKINLHNSGVGKILVNGKGFTVYMFTADKKRKDNCVSKSGCTGTWPLITTKGKPKAGKGVKQSLLGTIKVKGKQQVTYNGHPLYGYSGDGSAASTDYVGVSEFGGTWRALNASGKPVG